MTGAGTPRSTAAWVQRPSPLSDTPTILAKLSILRSTSAVRSSNQEPTTEPRRHNSSPLQHNQYHTDNLLDSPSEQPHRPL